MSRDILRKFSSLSAAPFAERIDTSGREKTNSFNERKYLKVVAKLAKLKEEEEGVCA